MRRADCGRLRQVASKNERARHKVRTKEGSGGGESPVRVRVWLTGGSALERPSLRGVVIARTSRVTGFRRADRRSSAVELADLSPPRKQRSDTHHHQDPARDRDEHVGFVSPPLEDCISRLSGIVEYIHRMPDRKSSQEFKRFLATGAALFGKCDTDRLPGTHTV